MLLYKHVALLIIYPENKIKVLWFSRESLVNGHFTLEPKRVVLFTRAEIKPEEIRVIKMAERRVFRYPKAPKLETEFVEENFEEEIGPMGSDSNNSHWEFLKQLEYPSKPMTKNIYLESRK